MTPPLPDNHAGYPLVMTYYYSLRWVALISAYARSVVDSEVTSPSMDLQPGEVKHNLSRRVGSGRLHLETMTKELQAEERCQRRLGQLTHEGGYLSARD
jgi:hypothetical protein